MLHRGIRGETSADLLRRADSAILAPMFLPIGINDLTAGLPLPVINCNGRA